MMATVTKTAETLPEWARTAGFALEDLGETGPPNIGFDNLIGPFYYRCAGDSHELLLHIEQRHINSGGLAHGGMLSAMTDLACSRAYWNHAGRPRYGFVTVNLTHEFIGAAPLGGWLVARCRVRQEGGSLVFVDCEMFVDEKLIGLSRCVMKKRKPPIPAAD